MLAQLGKLAQLAKFTQLAKFAQLFYPTKGVIHWYVAILLSPEIKL